MGRNNTRVTLAVLGQKVDDGFKSMRREIGELKQQMNKINNCVRTDELTIRTIDTTLTDHLKNHKRDLTLLGIFLTVIALIIGFVFQVIG